MRVGTLSFGQNEPGFSKGVMTMKKYIVIIFFCIAALSMSLSACAGSPDSDEMYELSGHTKKLSKMIFSAVVFKSAPEDLSEQELYVFATEKDPGIRNFFIGRTVKPYRVGKANGVLICDGDSKTALLEDTSCT